MFKETIHEHKLIKTDLRNVDQFLLDPEFPVKKLVIMTIGNVLLSDDGVGPIIYDELLASNLNYPELYLINAELNPENYLKKIAEIKPSHIIIIDSIQAELEPGTIYFFDDEEIDHRLFALSTHMVSLMDLSNYLIKSINNYKILNIGIQVKNTDFGLNLLDTTVYESAVLVRDYLTKLLLKIFKSN